MAKERRFKSTKELKVSSRIIEQVIGQEDAVKIVRKAARQRRHVLLIGEPGTGKSLLGLGLAELLPKEKLVDIVAFSNPNDENQPLVRVLPAGRGREIVSQARMEASGFFRHQNIVMFVLLIIALITPWWAFGHYSSVGGPLLGGLMFLAFFIGGIVFLASFVLFLNFSRRTEGKGKAPKIVVDNFHKKQAPFLDATGAHAGALLGDVLHDPFQSFLGNNKLLFHEGKTEKPKVTTFEELAAKYFKKYESRIVKGNSKNYEAIHMPEEEFFIVGENSIEPILVAHPAPLTLKTKVLKPVEALSINRYDYDGELIRIKTSSGREIVVTPEHRIAVWKNETVEYAESIRIKESDDLITTEEYRINGVKTFADGKAGSNTEYRYVRSTATVVEKEKFHYKGKLYNITTSSGNVIVNGVLCKNSGGLGTPSHERIVAGMIHKAHMGVLFIDEIATLEPATQQELLTALQEGKYAITGQSERSAGAMVRTEAVPCNFVLVAAGNAETVAHMHPALRSRIRGYGYEIYMKDTLPDTPENRDKIALFVAQEVVKDKKIPHFSYDAVQTIITEAKKRGNRKNHLTLLLRDLGGLIRAAGDLALEEGASLVEKKHVLSARAMARTLEQQMADKIIEHRKEYEVIVTEGNRVGRVNGLAILGSGSAHSGIILPIEAEVTPGGEEREIVATGKLGEIAKEAVKNVSAIIKKYFGEDIRKKHDLYVQFLQTYEGVEGDSASIAVATAIISALKEVPIKQDCAMTGSLSVRGEVLPVGGVSSKVEAALEAGIRKVLVPKTNLNDIIIDPGKRAKIQIIPVEKIGDVLKEALYWKGKERILKKIIAAQA